ncbi:hypothetical protein VTK73DRAFT_8650 [Phialemonium thermophilum]|uniref:Uncharacterized protein n=1 Tax=Phialemonium thermophilum TaxID=223376 RepID=A0ABR3W7C1_9PEZI
MGGRSKRDAAQGVNGVRSSAALYPCFHILSGGKPSLHLLRLGTDKKIEHSPSGASRTTGGKDAGQKGRGRVWLERKTVEVHGLWLPLVFTGGHGLSLSGVYDVMPGIRPRHASCLSVIAKGLQLLKWLFSAVCRCPLSLLVLSIAIPGGTDSATRRHMAAWAFALKESPIQSLLDETFLSVSGPESGPH